MQTIHELYLQFRKIQNTLPYTAYLISDIQDDIRSIEHQIRGNKKDIEDIGDDQHPNALRDKTLYEECLVNQQNYRERALKVLAMIGSQEVGWILMHDVPENQRPDDGPSWIMSVPKFCIDNDKEAKNVEGFYNFTEFYLSIEQSIAALSNLQ